MAVAQKLNPAFAGIDADVHGSGVVAMWHITHLFGGHGHAHLAPFSRRSHGHPLHALLARLSTPAAVQMLLLAGATLLFVLACLGLILVGAAHAH